jgi:hypothetical protein
MHTVIREKHKTRDTRRKTINEVNFVINAVKKKRNFQAFNPNGCSLYADPNSSVGHKQRPSAVHVNSAKALD